MNDLKIIESTGLIKIYETEKGESVVNARDLHEGLCSNSKFADWVKNRLDECDSVENQDYVSLSKNLESGGRTKEYLLKLDIAKEMAMLERNEKGKEYRRYFIDIEKKFKSAQIDTASLSPELQMFNKLFTALAQIELSAKEVKQELQQEIQGMRDVISMDTTSWREDSRKLIAKIAMTMGGYEYIKEVNKMVYELLDKRMGTSIQKRLANKRNRMAGEGVCKSKRDNLTGVDIIADDKKLIEGYVAIIKELTIKHGA